jgi:hypothetical protein
VVPEFVFQKWTCPDCGRDWVATKVSYFEWPDNRVPDGVDPEMLAWRGALESSRHESVPHE